MDPLGLIEDLMHKLAPNATVVDITEVTGHYRVRVAGTSGVVADCELPVAAVTAATHRGTARARLAVALKRCADDVDARIPDARGSDVVIGPPPARPAGSRPSRERPDR
jgi:hypothetical protein